jgi:DNA-binding transcriptional regulator GbsR (MarR family)
MRTAMKELQEAMVVMDDIEKKRRKQFRTRSDKSRVRSEELRLRTEKNLAEIAEKLNRLIGPQ